MSKLKGFSREAGPPSLSTEPKEMRRVTKTLGS